MKFTVVFLLACVLISHAGLGQSTAPKVELDSPRKISKSRFDKLVDSCISQLETKRLVEIPDSMHVNIMMCLNTIFMAHDKPNFTPTFTGGKYEKLEQLAEKIKYGHELTKIHTDWIPNRGMGYYYPKLKMELYGTPRMYAWFDVSN